MKFNSDTSALEGSDKARPHNVIFPLLEYIIPKTSASHATFTERSETLQEFFLFAQNFVLCQFS
jgi:hypothetical protein